MSDEKFLIKYEELLNKDYCNCNEMNCIDNNSPRRILNIAKKLQQENQQLKEEYKKLEDKLVETENWLRTAILQLMDFEKQDYYWITDKQIDSAKLVPIEFTMMGDKSVKFEKLERGVNDE